MEINQILTGLVIVGGLAGYYWFKVARHGGTAGYQKKLMGLRDGEVLASQWNAYFDFDQSTGDKVFDAVAGMTTRGKHLYVGITNKDRPILAHMDESRPPDVLRDRRGRGHRSRREGQGRQHGEHAGHGASQGHSVPARRRRAIPAANRRLRRGCAQGVGREGFED